MRFKTAIASEYRGQLNKRIIAEMRHSNGYIKPYKSPSHTDTHPAVANRDSMHTVVSWWNEAIASSEEHKHQWNETAAARDISGYNLFIFRARKNNISVPTTATGIPPVNVEVSYKLTFANYTAARCYRLHIETGDLIDVTPPDGLQPTTVEVEYKTFTDTVSKSGNYAYAIAYADVKTTPEELPQAYHIATYWKTNEETGEVDYALCNVTAVPPMYAYWKFNETEGTTTYDSSGHSRNGTIIGGITHVPGKLNYCVHFPNDTSRISHGNIADFGNSDKFSFEWWTKTTKIDDNFQFVKFDDSIARGYYILLNWQGKLFFVFKTDGSSYLQINTNNSGMNNGEFNHIVLTYDGSNTPAGFKVYFNSILQSLTQEGAGMGTNFKTTADYTIGVNNASIACACDIDNFVVYDRELSQAEVTDHYNGGAGKEL